MLSVGAHELVLLQRFLRIHLIKDAIERTSQPATYRDAIAKAVAIINSVTVPMGDIPGHTN